MKKEKTTHEESQEWLRSPLDLWKLIGAGGGRARPVSSKGRRTESLLAVFKNRVTYTFVMNNDVASIHFDREKAQIFFKGHNIQNLKLTEAQIEALNEFKRVLREDDRGGLFLKDYEATLGKLLADNS